MERTEKIEIVLQGIKKHPRIINESVRFDSPYGISKMLGVTMEEAQEIKQIFKVLEEIVDG